jgi:glycosyltransferase involved in cell wall biosynthesis
VNFLFVFHDRPNYFGGPIVNARRLLPELCRRGHQVHCLILYGGGASPSMEYLQSQGVKCFARPMVGYTEGHVRWLLQQLSTLKPDIFIANAFVSAWFAGRWAREAGIPSVAVMRSDEPFCWTMVDEFVVGRKEWAVSGLVCVAEGLRRRVLEKEPLYTKLQTIPSGVPITSKISDQTGSLRLVYVGRLVQEQKRILELIDALARVMVEHSDIRATLIGEGDQQAAVLQRIENLGLGARIEVLGTVPNETIQDKLAEYDVLVLLSDSEGTPGAVMDGMAAGLVPVCLDIPGGVRELVIPEQTGLLVQNRDGDFTEAIGRLAQDVALRRRLSVNAKAHVEESFSLKVAANRWEEFCHELLLQAGPSRPFKVPKVFFLPPLRPELAREDRRYRSLAQRIYRTARRVWLRLSRQSS